MLDHYGADRLGIPDLLPFSFSFRPELQLVTQLENPEVIHWLRRVYQEDANVGYLQEGHALSVPYGDEFLRFLDQLLVASRMAPRTAMEIGCGGVYLLRMLKARGLEVCGVDPSPVSAEQARRSGIELITEFYPSPSLTRKADLIFHHNVLEHVADPVAFLRAHHANLEPRGLVVTAVPDCSEAIERGDISMMLHEHLVYFDEDSLARTLTAAGFEVLEIGRSRYGGVLFGAGRAPGTAIPESAGVDDHGKFDRFCRNAESAIERFRRWMYEHSAPGRGAGFYVPLRAIPYLAACGRMGGYRFFDDDPGIRGKYFCGVDVPVENFDDLAAHPVDSILVASLAFGEKIAGKMTTRLKDRIRVTLLRDLVAPTAPGN
jgi:2-polyprenyl-3-methyl-5-hydroxy-6-metoxy-1,4-benzoquinol methylase